MPNRQKHTFHPWGPLLEVAYDLLNHAFATNTKKKRMLRMRRVSESCLWPLLHDNSHRCRDSRCKDFCKHCSPPISVMWQLTQGNILEHLLGPFSCPLTSNESLKWLMLCKFKTRRNEMSVAILIRGQVTLNGSCWRFILSLCSWGWGSSIRFQICKEHKNPFQACWLKVKMLY